MLNRPRQQDRERIEWSGKKLESNKQFNDRLFDRDTLLLREYNVNLLFIIAAYGAYEDWTKPLRETIRKDMIDFLNDKYIFFEIVPKPIPVKANGHWIMDIPFLDYHHSRLRGKIYKPSDKSEKMIIAYERESAIDKADLEDAKINLPSSVEGQSLSDPITLKP